jgi:glutamate decarboxylase
VNDDDDEVYDLADLTPQCGRRGDALKMFLEWMSYGRAGYASLVEHAFQVAQYLFTLLEQNPNFVLISRSPLACLQVCFYWAKNGVLSTDPKENDAITQRIVSDLIPRGWMIEEAWANSSEL